VHDSTSLREVYRCASQLNDTTLSLLMSTWHLVNLVSLRWMNSRHEETDSHPLEVSKKKPDYKQYRPFFLHVTDKIRRHFSPLRSLLLMSCLVIGSFRPFSLLTLPIMLDATKPSHLTPFSEVAAICNGQTMAQILLVALRLSLISSECLLRSSSSILRRYPRVELWTSLLPTALVSRSPNRLSTSTITMH
jgi:hypothetical protein